MAFVIAELGSTWRFGSDHKLNAFHMISQAREAGADAVKLQWTSDATAMAVKRKMPQNADNYRRFLEWPREWVATFASYAEQMGISFMCTVFLEKDIEAIEPYVSHFKVSAFESSDKAFIEAHKAHGGNIIVSCNDRRVSGDNIYSLHCVSEYPTPLERLKVGRVREYGFDGISDHSTSLISGAVAVGAGARYIEKHVRHDGTPETNPDYPHSLTFDDCKVYVLNIRRAEVML